MLKYLLINDLALTLLWVSYMLIQMIAKLLDVVRT